MSSASSTSEDETEDGGARGAESSSRRRGSSSASTRRRANGVWPEPFLESLAVRVATDAARSGGRLAAGYALANIFQVCSQWRAISGSELLWQALHRRIWGMSRRSHATWHDDYVYRHRTALNFHIGRATYTPLELAGNTDGANRRNTCLRVALSDAYLACGFLDGSVRVFDMGSNHWVSRFRPTNPDRLGPFSHSISGIVLRGNNVIFASLDGNVCVGMIPGRNSRLAHVGSVYDDGLLIDFAGCSRWWIGLFSGAPGRAFHIWNGVTEEISFIGGGLTDPEAVLGWQLLTEPQPNHRLGRVRVADEHLAVAVTASKAVVLDLQHGGFVLSEEEPEEGIVVDSLDVQGDRCLMVYANGVAKVAKVRGMEEVCSFYLGDIDVAQVKILCSLNSGYAFTSIDGTISVWDAEAGEFLYDLEFGIDDGTDLVADDEHVAGCSASTGVHLWDFRALF
ncbi:transcriptional regulator STERILE APETALA [Nymphaea colorata]|nr:transcriptional regulator STERILE APETALA [Nymphaea colorata]